MRTRVRTASTVTLTALLATVTLAAYVGAQPALDHRVVTVSHRLPAVAAPRPVGAPLPPVTTTPVRVGALAALSGAANPVGDRAVTQVLQLTVAGGALDLVADRAVVELERVAGSETDWIGTLRPIRVVDARGTHAGWAVSWTMTSIETSETTDRSHLHDAKVRLAPDVPIVVAGSSDGVGAGRPGAAALAGRTLFRATPGFGGGTYEAGATVSARLPASVDADRVSVTLAFTLA